MDAQELAAFGRYEEALAKLDRARAMPDLIAYEASMIESIMGSYYYEIDESATSIIHFRNAIKSGGLLAPEIKALEADIGRLYYEAKDFKTAARLWSGWMDRNGETPLILKHVMQAHVQDGNFSAAFDYADKWFATGKVDEDRPDDLMTWLQLDLKNRDLSHSFPQTIRCY